MRACVCGVGVGGRGQGRRLRKVYNESPQLIVVGEHGVNTASTLYEWASVQAWHLRKDPLLLDFPVVHAVRIGGVESHR